MHEGAIPVVDPTTADGVFSLAWLVIALPLAGAAILLIGGAIAPKRFAAFGHLLGTLLPIGSFAISLAMFLALLGRDDGDRQVGPAPLRLDRHRRPARRHGPALRPADRAVPAADHRRRLADPRLLDRLHGARRRAGSGSSATSTCSSPRCSCWSWPRTTSALFLGWEGVGLASYLLIGFWQHKHSAAAAAKKAFVINRVGDMGLSAAIMLAFATWGSTSFTVISANADGASEKTMTALGPAAAARRLRQVRPGAAAGLAARRDGGPDPGVGPDPRGDHGDRGRLPDRPLQLHLRARPRRPDRGGHRRHRDAAVGRDHRLRQGRHQEGAGRLHDEPDRLHDARRRPRVGRATRSRSSTCSPTASSRPTCSSAPARSCTAWTTTSTCATTARCARCMPVTFLTFAMGYLAIIGFPGFSGFWSKDKIIEVALDRELAGRRCARCSAPASPAST